MGAANYAKLAEDESTKPLIRALCTMGNRQAKNNKRNMEKLEKAVLKIQTLLNSEIEQEGGTQVCCLSLVGWFLLSCNSEEQAKMGENWVFRDSYQRMMAIYTEIDALNKLHAKTVASKEAIYRIRKKAQELVCFANQWGTYQEAKAAGKFATFSTFNSQDLGDDEEEDEDEQEEEEPRTPPADGLSAEDELSDQDLEGLFDDQLLALSSKSNINLDGASAVVLADDVPQVDGAGVLADAVEEAVGGSAQQAAAVVKETKPKTKVKAEPGSKAKKRKQREEESATTVASKKPSVVGNGDENAGAEAIGPKVVGAVAFTNSDDDAAGGTSA
jgi:hypothetical protein